MVSRNEEVKDAELRIRQGGDEPNGARCAQNSDCASGYCHNAGLMSATCQPKPSSTLVQRNIQTNPPNPKAEEALKHRVPAV